MALGPVVVTPHQLDGVHRPPQGHRGWATAPPAASLRSGQENILTVSESQTLEGQALSMRVREDQRVGLSRPKAQRALAPSLLGHPRASSGCHHTLLYSQALCDPSQGTLATPMVVMAGEAGPTVPPCARYFTSLQLRP